MLKLGIIANPTSGKDIRRLVGQALVVGNREKVNIVKRALIGAHAAGIRNVLIMPDHYGIGVQAMHDLGSRYGNVIAGASILEMELDDTGNDSISAAQHMNAWGADCIITLGGDGTVRVAAKGAGKTPLIPISTGTNNVIPAFIEGTIAGMTAGCFSRIPLSQRNDFLQNQKRLNLYINDVWVDSALVDLAVIADQHVGSRAVWEPEKLLQVFVSRASPTNIGLTSIIGSVQTVLPEDPFGAVATIDGAGHMRRILAAIGPGLVTEIGINNIDHLKFGQKVPIISRRPVALALDGEREHIVLENDRVEVLLDGDGPRFVKVEKTLEAFQAGKNNSAF